MRTLARVALTHATLTCVAVAALGGFSMAMTGVVKAQERMVIQVKPRSWLDAGRVVPVGSMQNYINDIGGISDHTRFGARGSNSGLLPDRFESGRGFMFETPNFRGLD